MTFRFTNPTLDAMDVLALGTSLAGFAPAASAMSFDKFRMYLVTGVARSSSISVVALNDQNTAVDLGVDVLQLASLGVGASISKSTEGEYTFSGGAKLAFGFQGIELIYDSRKNLLHLGPQGQVIKGFVGPPIPKPVFLGDPEGDPFIQFK